MYIQVLETESSICLVMEYCAGGHIEDYISPTRPMTESAARFYFTQVCLCVCVSVCLCVCVSVSVSVFVSVCRV